MRACLFVLIKTISHRGNDMIHNDEIRGEGLLSLVRTQIEEMALIERRQRFAAARKGQPAPITHEYDEVLETFGAVSDVTVDIDEALYADMIDAALVEAERA